MRKIELPHEYALVLQQILESGEEDITNLAESLRLDRARMVHIIQSLRHKGLIKLTRTAQDTWIQLSSKGRRFVMMAWPESYRQFSY